MPILNTAQKRLNKPDKGTLSAASQSKLLLGRLARPVSQPPMAALCFATATRCPVICVDLDCTVSSAAAGITSRRTHHKAENN